jgi:hypothetical protein
MNHRTPSKFLPIVVLSICSFATLNASGAGDGNAVYGGLVKTNAQSLAEGKRADLNSLKSECKSAEEQRIAAQAKFLIFCQKEDKQKVLDKNGTPESRQKALKNCAEYLDECREAGDKELPLYSAASGMNTSGASAFMQLADGEDNPKKCSEYSKSEFNSQIEKMESNLDRRKEAYGKLLESSNRDEESFQDKYNRMQNEMSVDQKNKTKSDYASKDDDRRSQAELNKQRQDFDAKIRQTDLEIFQLQQQQSLLTTQQGKAVSNFKKALIKCQADYDAAMAAPKAPRSGLTTATVSPAKKLFALCREDAVKDRNVQSEAYDSEFAKYNKMISAKMQEMQAAKAAADQMNKMYSDAMAEKAAQKNEEDQQFFNDQRQKFTQMAQATSQKQAKAFQTQQLIADAQNSVNMANNKLDQLQSEAPLGNKPLEDIKGEVLKYNSLSDAMETMGCSSENLKKAQTAVENADAALQSGAAK